jgi:hypothetical protein
MEEETFQNNNNNNVSSTESPQQQLVSNSFPQVMNMNMNIDSTSLVNTVVPPVTSMVPPVTSTVTTTTPTGNSGGTSLDLFGKKKRGRPRKYDADGNLNPSYKKEKPPTLTSPTSPPPGFTLSTNDFSSKKGRGKPTAFGNYQILSSFGQYISN